MTRQTHNNETTSFTYTYHELLRHWCLFCFDLTIAFRRAQFACPFVHFVIWILFWFQRNFAINGLLSCHLLPLPFKPASSFQDPLISPSVSIMTRSHDSQFSCFQFCYDLVTYLLVLLLFVLHLLSYCQCSPTVSYLFYLKAGGTGVWLFTVILCL